MNQNEMTRRAFLVATGAVSASAAFPGIMSAQTSQPVAKSDDAHSAPRITPMLYGIPRRTTDLETWFASMKRWGVQQWMAFATADRPRYGSWGGGPQVDGTAFLADAWPGFKPYVETRAVADQEAFIRKMAALSEEAGIEFWLAIPFPLFPSSKRAVVEKVAPYFFKDGQVNLYEPRLAELLKAEIRAFKKALPMLKGVNLWLAEGSGSMGSPTAADLAHLDRWETPLVDAFHQVTRELNIGGILFAHEYLLTVGEHRKVYEMMHEFPELVVMDDITWPEEDMLHPFLGYLPEPSKKLLYQSNPVALNFLLDTEYLGEGVLPSVYPRWWQHNIKEAVRHGTSVGMGRTFFWDNGLTDENFNRLNAHMFTRFCYDPDLPARQVLGEAAKEMFGDHVPERLIEILWETEPIVKKVIGVNGVDSFDHSRFPEAVYLDVVYTPQGNAMKAIDDLFRAPGTKLYPPLTDELNNFKQWRWQNKTVSEPAASYLDEKREAVAWVQGVLPQVRQLSRGLASHHRLMFVHGYEILAAAAQGMELFVETAAVHYQWAHAKSVDDHAARVRFDELAGQFRALAAKVPENPFLYKERMLSMAKFLNEDLPRIGSVFQPKAHHGDRLGARG